MSSVASNAVSEFDTRELVENLEYEELFEGTVLEGVEDEDGSIAEAVGRRLGEIVGRVVGEALGRRLGAYVVPVLLDDTPMLDDREDSTDSDASDAEESDTDDAPDQNASDESGGDESGEDE